MCVCNPNVICGGFTCEMSSNRERFKEKEINGLTIRYSGSEGKYYFTDTEGWTFSDENLGLVEQVARDYPIK